MGDTERLNTLTKEAKAFETKIVQMETVLTEKEKSYKEAVTELKDSGVDVKNIKTWREKLSKEIESELEKAANVVSEMKELLGQYEF